MGELVQFLSALDSGAYDWVFIAFIFPMALVVIYDMWKRPGE